MAAAIYQFFLSSTSEDLKEHRARVALAIRTQGDLPVQMETFGADPREPVTTCLAKVASADALVVLVGNRYGWVPTRDQGGDGEKSITWLEVEAARHAGRPVFAFLSDPTFALPGRSDQDDLALASDEADRTGILERLRRLHAFRQFLEGSFTRATFTTPDDAAATVAPSLARWIRDRTATFGSAFAAPAAARSDLIDFRSELSRHRDFFGRDDIIDTLAQWALQDESRPRWIGIVGGPGVGKSAILNQFIARLESRPDVVVVRHFLRRQVGQWARPDVVRRSLAAQIEARYPELADPDANADTRLLQLLNGVSALVGGGDRGRLVAVVDGLDEAESEMPDENPLPLFLPYELPAGVTFVCGSRPKYPHLSWLAARTAYRSLVLDQETASNEHACRAFWNYHAPRLGLGVEFIDDAVSKAQGNLLHAVRLRDWLEARPVDQRRAVLVPEGLRGFLDLIWEEHAARGKEERGIVQEGLSVLAVAREALPRSLLDELLVDAEKADVFLRLVRPLLLEDREAWLGEKGYRLFHESFREFVIEKVGPRVGQVQTARLLSTIAAWPPRDGSTFDASYAVKHGVDHRLELKRWDDAWAILRDTAYLESHCAALGVSSLQLQLARALAVWPESDIRHTLTTLYRAIQSEAHWLAGGPTSLASLVYNRFVAAGVAPGEIARILHFAGGLPPARLRHPIRADWSITLSGHREAVAGCAITPDGRRVVSASRDHTLKVWDLTTGRCLMTLEGHAEYVRACAVSPDGQQVVSASDDRTLRVWDLATGRLLQTLEGHTKGVDACVFHPDCQRVLSASGDRTLKLWRIASGRAELTLEGHTHAVRGCAISGDGRLGLSASADFTLKVWNLDTGNELIALRGHTDSVHACAISVDGGRALSASSDQTLKLWDVKTGEAIMTLKGHTAWVDACAMSADGRLALSSSADEKLKLWNLRNGEVIRTLEGHQHRILGCALSSDGRLAVSASKDETLKVWDLQTDLFPPTDDEHTGAIVACAISPDGRRALSSDGPVLKLWDVDTGTVVMDLMWHRDTVEACAFSADGQLGISASSDKKLALWDLSTREWLRDLDCAIFPRAGHRGLVRSCAFSPTEPLVAGASDHGALCLWDVTTGERVHAFEESYRDVWACTFSPDGTLLAAAYADRKLRVWEVATRQLRSSFEHGGYVFACAFSPDGRRIVSGGEQILKVWDLKTTRCLRTLTGHAGNVRGVAFCVDGRHALSFSRDKTLKLWNLESGACTFSVSAGAAFTCLAVVEGVAIAGDVLGNLWMLECDVPFRR